jgi:hypothetical protein
VEAAFVIRTRPDRARTFAAMVGMGLFVGLLALGLSAFRLWPVIEQLSASPRLLGGAPGNNEGALLKDLFGGLNIARGEMLVGVLAVPAIVASLTHRRTIPVVLTGWFWLWLSMGYSAKPSAFAVLRAIPPYTMLRYPERFLVLFALAAAVAAAIGVTRLVVLGRKRPRWRFAPLVALLLLVANTGLLMANDHAETHARTMVSPPTVVEQDFAQARGNRWLAAYYPAIGRGTLSCFDDYNVAQSPALRGDLPREEVLADPTAGILERDRWSPNGIDVRVDVTRPARVIINQNWHPGWKASVGEVVNDEGRLAVDVPAGRYPLRVRFRPRSAFGGALVSLLALAAAVWTWRNATRKDVRLASRRAWLRQLGLAAAPLLAVPLSFALMREPPRPPPPLVTPSGEPLVAELPPIGSRAIGAKFEGGITLAAATVDVTPSAEGGIMRLELDWRKTGEAARGLGIFVHIRTTGAGTVNADHVLLSNAVTLEAAPNGSVLRDVSADILLPPSKEPRVWTVNVGIWRARAGGSRVKVLEPGTSLEATDDTLTIWRASVP